MCKFFKFTDLIEIRLDFINITYNKLEIVFAKISMKQVLVVKIYDIKEKTEFYQFFRYSKETKNKNIRYKKTRIQDTISKLSAQDAVLIWKGTIT